MFVRHLGLANFRNYVRLDLALAPGLSVLWGDNGQGKTNLLEALYLLATSRSHRTSAERELVNWHAGTTPVFARAAADVERHPSPVRLEVVLVEAAGASTGAGGPAAAPVASTVPGPAAGLAAGPGDEAAGAPANGSESGRAGRAPAAAVRRRVRINGHHRRPSDLLGHLNVVLFSPEDVNLVAGPAEVRRRYLNVALCQIDQHYLRALQRYLRVLQQRNALLREVRERPANAGSFEYWDSQLVELGAALMAGWLRAITWLNEHLAEVHPRLTRDPAGLRAAYRPNVPLGADVDELGRAAAADGEAAVVELLRARFEAHLATVRARERHQGVTLAGPHRDDAAFMVGPVDLRVYGSRGQQRAAALGVKLAEAALMERYTAERPVLLLDDVMSELDSQRRDLLEAIVLDQQQVLLTASDPGVLSAGFLGRADRYRVEAGSVLKS
jgi:DNA replication and repair protein RecF